jgi:nucleotide-binding universal stress UspA family protein
MKKILYTTDFSMNAEKAFPFALKIAEKHHADLIMLHVFDVPPGFGHPNNTIGPAEMKRQAGLSWESNLQEFFEQFNADIHPMFIAVENNSVVKGILSVIKEHKPDLVVTGTKGKSLLKEIFVGSTTKALVKQSAAPVLAIPANADYRDFDNVLYASDFREVDLEALEQLIELVKPYKPEIKLIHVSSTDNEYKSIEKMEWLKDLVIDNISYKNISFELLLSDRVFERLTNYVQHHDLDMMVMLEKERHGIVEKLFHEDLVWKMEFHTTIPILSYNEHYLRATYDQDIKKGDTIEH